MVAALAVPLGRRPLAKAEDVSPWHSLGPSTIGLWIGKGLAPVNGHDVSAHSDNTTLAPIILNGRTMVPVRFVAEQLGADIQRDPASATVTITGTAP